MVKKIEYLVIAGESKQNERGGRYLNGNGQTEIRIFRRDSICHIALDTSHVVTQCE